MIQFFRTFALLFSLASGVLAQQPSPAGSSESSQLLELSRKIDQQNIKIDLLSQQILRLQQEIEHPGMATTTAPHATEATAPAATAVTPAGDGRTHVVAKGETLTSIAKMHKVSIGELQKFNHIEDDRKLQIGQTLNIPGAAGATTATPTPAASTPNE